MCSLSLKICMRSVTVVYCTDISMLNHLTDTAIYRIYDVSVQKTDFIRHAAGLPWITTNVDERFTGFLQLYRHKILFLGLFRLSMSCNDFYHRFIFPHYCVLLLLYFNVFTLLVFILLLACFTTNIDRILFKVNYPILANTLYHI